MGQLSDPFTIHHHKQSWMKTKGTSERRCWQQTEHFTLSPDSRMNECLGYADFDPDFKGRISNRRLFRGAEAQNNRSTFMPDLQNSRSGFQLWVHNCKNQQRGRSKNGAGMDQNPPLINKTNANKMRCIQGAQEQHSNLSQNPS